MLYGTWVFTLAQPLGRAMAMSAIVMTDNMTRVLSPVFLATSAWIRRYAR